MPSIACMRRIAAAASIVWLLALHDGSPARAAPEIVRTDAESSPSRLAPPSAASAVPAGAEEAARRRALRSFDVWRPPGDGAGTASSAAFDPSAPLPPPAASSIDTLDPTPLPSCTSMSVPMQPGYACETPYSDVVRLHVLITMVDRSGYRDLRYLGAIGLSGADVYVYLRTRPNDTRPARVDLPCGMRLHERLLLPNLGEEGAVFATHVAAVYDAMPDAVINLHGGPLYSWHSHCAVVIRRLKAFYRGLGSGAEATPAMKAFAADVVTLNSLVMKGKSWVVNDCCGPLLCKTKVQPERDYPQCPWERVGPSRVLYKGRFAQPLCRLRDSTPQTNWTVVAEDVPLFFIRQPETLEKYALDPLCRVPLTHTPPRRRLLVTRDSSHESTSSASEPAGGAPRSDGGSAPTRPRARRLASAGWRGESRVPSFVEGAAQAAVPEGGEELVNLRDFVLPMHREGDLKAGDFFFADENDRVYGLERIWIWMLKAHGMYEAYVAPPREVERPAEWCCFQFAAPKHVLLRGPKAWWEDLAFFATHLGWKERSLWPVSIGIVFEYRLWRSLGRRYMTREGVDAYVAVDREMGADAVLGGCETSLATPLCI